MRNFILTSVLGAAIGLPLLGGCGGDGYADRSYRDRDHDWNHRDNDYARTAGDRNTRISDKMDDGRVNGSARSYEERKASRAADEGIPGAARREAELRNDRLDR